MAVIWDHSPSSIFGYVVQIPARIIEITEKRARIEFQAKGGAVMYRKVPPCVLRPKPNYFG